MTTQTVKSAPTGADPKVTDALKHVRSAGQELHRAISDAVTKRAGATKADLEAFGNKVKTVADSAKNSVKAQNAAVKKHMADAVAQLEVAQKHVTDGLKASGEKFQASARQAVADARTTVQKISEAVAAQRSAASTKPSK